MKIKDVSQLWGQNTEFSYCYVIGEIGINHNGSMELAKKLIQMAKYAGCDAVKFQKRNPEEAVPNHLKDLPRETPWGVLSYLDYKKRIEEELYRNCDDIIQTIRNSVLSKASEDEPRSFFLKMIGDYCRYIAESAKDDRLEKTKNDALSAYQEAQIISEKSLNACNSIRLGLALNFSVFHYEVMQNVTKACELGDKALQDALDRLDDCDEEIFRDAQSIIELLRENLSLWKEEGGDNDQQ